MEKVTREQFDAAYNSISKMNEEQKTWMLMITSFLIISFPEIGEDQTRIEKAQEDLDSVLTPEEKETFKRIQDEVDALD